MMQIYRRLQPIKAISFDLDDTLYNNVPVIRHAEKKLLEFVNQQLSGAGYPSLDNAQWLAHKHAFSQRNLQLAHDVSALRQAFLLQFFTQHGIPKPKESAQQAYQLFFQYRNNINVSESIVAQLIALKPHYPLIAITNGNAEPDLIGLSGIFDLVLRPRNHLRMKPAADLFVEASRLLTLKAQQILHVGDSEITDVAGAIRSGCQSVWFNPEQRHFSGPTLPDAQVSSIEQLTLWLINQP
ncbi:HAD family hydrolase [Catenovulum agarivorans DS-2]|uniref:HAD family hydrolase n=1 Tax=Catenovulum agarivorans DS-2 TaxID=1328313 RepID=W7QUY7_9ALTE|nr:HAD family hydrolase [Catenovulum agarivorans]EWH09100.1 HAD family hydrolase [Catenovulum agarivorans DS-2]